MEGEREREVQDRVGGGDELSEVSNGVEKEILSFEMERRLSSFERFGQTEKKKKASRGGRGEISRSLAELYRLVDLKANRSMEDEKRDDGRTS